MRYFVFLSFFVFSIFADNGLKQTSKAFSEIGKKAIPSVVFIKAQYNGSGVAYRAQEDYENPFDYFNDEFLRRFFGMPSDKPNIQPQEVGGSGFIVSNDGYIITNNHVVKDATRILAILNNGEESEAKLIGADPRTDLAVLKIDKKELPALSFGDSDQLEIGEWVVAIGNPFELQASLTVGVVSAKGRQNLRITDLEDFIQTDAAINPGNSGGPLLNLDCQMVGVNTAIVSKTGGYMGIGFAIPSNMVKHVFEQIIHNGHVNRGYLGIYLQDLDKEMAEALHLEKVEGIVIAEIPKNSPAEKAGLKQGDLILEYNGHPVKTMNAFRNEIALLEPGTKVTLKILREGKEKIITIILGSSPEEQLASKEAEQMGIDVAELKDIAPETLRKWNYYPDMEGVMITHVKSGSLAAKAGIRPGMLLFQINYKKIKNLNDFKEGLGALTDQKHAILLVRYQNVTRFVTIKLK